jgi:hypothetical protein
MKKLVLILGSVSCILFGASCNSTDLSGSLPLPFTNPPSSIKGEIDVQPIPPKVCVGLDIIPTKD